MNNINKFKERLLPLTIVITGFYLIIFKYYFPIKSELAYSLLDTFSQSLIISGIVVFAIRLIENRLTKIENQLEITKDNKVSNVNLIPSENYITFIEQIIRNKFVYKASIYIPNTNIETLFFLKSFFNSIEIDSTARIVINIKDADENALKNIANTTIKYKKQIELRELDSTLNYFIVILDTKIWILTDFGSDVKNNLLFNVSSYEEQGKSYIDLFNKIWNQSSIMLLNSGDDKNN